MYLLVVRPEDPDRSRPPSTPARHSQEGAIRRNSEFINSQHGQQRL
jgi:hypothetical protein